jgi:hypothetical protein
MAWSFGDGFDLYAAPADAINGYWDSGATLSNFSLNAGRFSGSRGLGHSGGGCNLVKSSGANDAVHHFVVSFEQTAALGGATQYYYIELLDGATVQCSIVFLAGGNILLQSGAPGGTTLATYTNAFTAQNTWYGFEFEVVINNTTGRFRARKNGNTVDDFDSGAVLNTRGGTANNYVNKIQIGVINGGGPVQVIDDLFWRSDASSVAWMGDIRCYTRMPASDQSVQFSRTPSSTVQTPGVVGGTQAVSNTVAYYAPVVPLYDGTIGSVTIQFSAGYTGNLKCTLFNGTSTSITTIIASATTLSNPSTGTNTITFPSPPSVLRGGTYWLGVISDTSSGTYQATNLSIGRNVNTSYAAFPTANIATSQSAVPFTTFTLSLVANYATVSEAQEDGLTSYVYDSTVSHADFYNLGSITPTPSPGAIVALVTRGYMQKSDAGSRTASMQIKSGATTVATPTLTLTTSGWQWAWRTDLVDPNTSAAWTAAAANAVTFGPLVVS